MHTLKKAGIIDAGYFLPGTKMDVCKWGPVNGVCDIRIERLLSNGCRYFYASTDYSDSELIINAIRSLTKKGYDLSSVRYVIHASTQPFSVPAAPDSILSKVLCKLRLKVDLCFSTYQLACASVMSGIDWAGRMLSTSHSGAQALVVTSDRVFGDANYRIRQDGVIQSDGASALLLGNMNYRYPIERIDFVHFPKLHEGIGVNNNDKLASRYTWMHTKHLFQTHNTKTGIPLSDYSTVLPVNADKYYWQLIAKALGVSENLFFTKNIRERGHACCADFAINLVDHGFACLEKGGLISACSQSNIGSHGILTLSPKQKEHAA